MLALIAAVPKETDLIRPQLQPLDLFPHLLLRQGVLCGQPILLAHSGVGKANAAAACALLLAKWPISAVLSFGCGGAFASSGLQVGDLALAKEEVFGDEGALTPEGFLGMEELGLPIALVGKDRYYQRLPLPRSLLERHLSSLVHLAHQKGQNCLAGAFVTVSSCSGSADQGRIIETRTGAICENMEGAGIALTCLHFQTPMLELRGISNLVEDRDLSRWDIPLAVKLAQEGVLKVLSDWQGAL